MADRPDGERRWTGGRRWRLPPVVPGITSALKEDHYLVAWPQHGSLAAQDRRREATLPDEAPSRRTAHATVELDVADIPVDGRVASILVRPKRHLVVRCRLALHTHEMRASDPTSATDGSFRYAQRRLREHLDYPRIPPRGRSGGRFPPVSPASGENIRVRLNTREEAGSPKNRRPRGVFKVNRWLRGWDSNPEPSD